MDVKRCDRCGAYFEQAKHNFILVASEAIISPDHKGYRLMYEGEPIDAKDLCNDCVQSFKHWFDVPALYMPEPPKEDT